MSNFDRLHKLVDQIKAAEEKYYQLDYEYRQIVDKLLKTKSDLLLNSELAGKTLKEKEAEITLLTEDLQQEKRRLYYESNMAKTQLNDLDREYKVLLAEANYKSNRTL